MLHAGCHIVQVLEEAMSPLQGLEEKIAHSTLPPPRRLRRTRFLQDSSGSSLAVCAASFSMCLVTVHKGRVFTSLVVDAASGWSDDGCRGKKRWDPVLDPLGETGCKVVSVCMSPWALLAIDSKGRVLSAGLCQSGSSSRANRQDSGGQASPGSIAGAMPTPAIEVLEAGESNPSGAPKALRWAQVPGLESLQGASLQSRFGQVFLATRQGELYAWGLSSGDGTPARACSVGLPGSPKDLHSPVRVSGVLGVDRFGFGRAPISSVSCGVAHAVFLSAGVAFAVGQGCRGQLGSGGLRDAEVPVRMALPAHVQVRVAACGLHQTLLVSSEGEAWGCGSNSLGELPVRRFSSGVITPEMALEGLTRWSFEPLPRRLDLLPDTKQFFVISVACGLCSSFFLGDNGAVFMTGSVHCSGPTPYGRPPDHEIHKPYRLKGLPPVREIAVSLTVPLKLPGIPFATLPEATSERPAELSFFRCTASSADEASATKLMAWATPGWDFPVEFHAPHQPSPTA